VLPRDRQSFKKWIAFNLAHVYYDSHYYEDRDTTMKTTPPGVYEPDFQTDRAIEYINANQNRKYCLFLSFGPPHQVHTGEFLPPGGDYTFPYDPASLTLRPNVDYFDPTYARQWYADYYGVISNLDWNVGRIMSTLEELGLAQDTILVFSSDHGVSLGSHYGEFGSFLKKGRIEAEILDVPFILRYPRRVSPQVVSDVFSTVDVLPTLLGLSKIPVPEGVMGRDFSPLLLWGGPPTEPPWGPLPSTTSVLVGFWGGNWLGLRTPEYSLDVRGNTLQPLKLYHNTIDPYQMTNFIDHPDYQLVKEELYAEFLAWLDYVGYG
jgi:arylsulfatase A-like enzyme